MAGYLKGIVKRVKKTVKQAQRPQKLLDFQKKLESAKADQILPIMDKREYLYLGDRAVDKNVNASTTPSKMTNNINNIIYELVESQVNNQIPQPAIKSKRKGFEMQARMIEDAVNGNLKESEIEAINDRNERITPVQGYSIVEICWDPDFKHHLYKGEIKLYGRHPKQLVTQPKVYSLQKMDYFFILSDVTKEYVKRRYGKDLAGEEEQYPENTRLPINDQSAAVGTETLRSGTTEEEEPLTEIVCYYKDEDGDVCKYVWINDTELEDLEKYLYRRINGQIKETETLTTDMIIGDGTTAKAGEEVPYFVPQRYPVSVRINVPRNFAFGGQSDVDVIRDQQDSIKRVAHKAEEKIVKGGTIVKAQDDHTTFQITDEIYQIVRGSAQQLQMIQPLDLTADISRDLEYLQNQYKTAQSMLGITNSYQGKEDQTAQSGKAKQIQVQQASGRLQSKQFNKYVHYKEIFEIMFEFMLAFYDELRPYLSQDENGQDVYGEFDKYKFLLRDRTGQLYYNTDFIFSSDGSIGLPKDPMFLYEQAITLFQAQAMDAMQLWSVLESLNFPQASDIKESTQKRMDMQGQMQQLQQENAILQEQVNQMGGHLQDAHQSLADAQQNNAQGTANTLSELNAGQQAEFQQQQQQQDKEHQRQMDTAKLQLEAQKINAMHQNQMGGGQVG